MYVRGDQDQENCPHRNMHQLREVTCPHGSGHEFCLAFGKNQKTPKSAIHQKSLQQSIQPPPPPPSLAQGDGCSLAPKFNNPLSCLSPDKSSSQTIQLVNRYYRSCLMHHRSLVFPLQQHLPCVPCSRCALTADKQAEKNLKVGLSEPSDAQCAKGVCGKQQTAQTLASQHAITNCAKDSS